MPYELRNTTTGVYEQARLHHRSENKRNKNGTKQAARLEKRPINNEIQERTEVKRRPTKNQSSFLTNQNTVKHVNTISSSNKQIPVDIRRNDSIEKKDSSQKNPEIKTAGKNW